VRTAVGLDIAGFIQLDLSCKEFGVGLVADEDKDPVHRKHGALSALDIFQAQVGHRGVAHNLFYNRIPDKSHLFMLQCPFLEYGVGAQPVTAVNDGHLLRKAGQKKPLIQGAVAAADHHHLLSREEKAVAGGAVGDPLADVFIFARQTQTLGGRSGSDDDHAGLKGFRRRLDDLDLPGQVHALHDIVEHLRTEAGRLLLKKLIDLKTAHPFRKARKVLQIVGQCYLATLFQSADHQGAKIGAPGVNGGRQPGRA